MKNRNTMNRIPVNEVRRAAECVISRLSEFWKEFRTPQLPRVCEEISWIYVEGGTVVDLGGSSGFHTSICANLGMKAICVDNFRVRETGHIDDHFAKHDREAEQVASELGVDFIHTDLLDWKPPFEDVSIDVIMSFDNIEHLHHSPRRLYKRMVKSLRVGGLFIIGAANEANLLKRVRVPIGKNFFSSIEECYMYELFIGHVREPIVSYLLFINRELDLDVLNIIGRNWLGLSRLPKVIQVYGKIFDKVLRLFPSLCSDIYLLSTKLR